jgi:acid phosphatase
MTTITVTASPSDCTAPKSYPTTPSFKRSVSVNNTYIRVLFNDAVYPIANCQDGPGNSCSLSQYADFIHQKNVAAGEFKDYCNVTTANAPTNINGAGFFTDLTLDYLTFLKPFFE